MIPARIIAVNEHIRIRSAPQHRKPVSFKRTRFKISSPHEMS
jgi:hypothetical protein